MDKKKELIFVQIKMSFLRTVRESLTAVGNKKYTIKTSNIIQIVGLLTVHLLMYFVVF